MSTVRRAVLLSIRFPLNSRPVDVNQIIIYKPCAVTAGRLSAWPLERLAGLLPRITSTPAQRVNGSARHSPHDAQAFNYHQMLILCTSSPESPKASAKSKP